MIKLTSYWVLALCPKLAFVMTVTASAIYLKSFAVIDESAERLVVFGLALHDIRGKSKYY